MAANSIKCTISTVEAEVFSAQIKFISVKGVTGELGITPGHTPLLTQIAPGPIEIIDQDDKREVIHLSGGYLEVQPDEVVILADLADRIDPETEAELMNDLSKAHEHMPSLDSKEFALVLAEISELQARLNTIARLRSKKS